MVCLVVAESERSGEVRQVGVFQNRPEILCKMAAKLSSGGRRLSFCYEAGPCGYGPQRLLTACGHSCIVVTPSLIPMKSGDRVKTDRHDAMMLAKLHRAGELTANRIPDATREAIRDLVRARATAGRVLSKARQHLQGFLLRHDRIYRGARANQTFRCWLTTGSFEHPAEQIVLQDYIHAVEDAEARRNVAGAIICNDDDLNEHPTTIGGCVFIGSNTALVTPVTIGDGAYVAAGSVITRHVQPDALSIACKQQVDKPGRAADIRARLRRKV